MPPVVYVGPSAGPDLVKRELRHAQMMPPIRRGDLYRDWAIGFRVFVILDGVFFQDLAVSPREIIDVIRAGGVVFGASSMGALRAADCWPAGMRGVGSIFRLFRRGSLTSDDEVAVAFSPEPPYRAMTVPLVNVRFATAQLVRCRQLSSEHAVRIVGAAADLYFADRTWERIIDHAAIGGEEDVLIASLDGHDLKQMDATRALTRVKAWLGADRRRPSGTRVKPSAIPPPMPREAPHAVTRADRWPIDRRELWEWLIATGRHRRHAAAALASSGHKRTSTAGRGALARDAEPGGLGRSVWTSRLGVTAADLKAARSRRQIMSGTASHLLAHDSALARAVWADIAAAGEMDTVVLRFLAVRAAAAWARARSLVPEARHRHVARTGIAQAHGFRGWAELRAAVGAHSPVWPWIARAAEHAALARRARQECFTGRLPEGRPALIHPASGEAHTP